MELATVVENAQDTVLLEPPTDLPAVEEDLLVEAVSIDGMCGVY